MDELLNNIGSFAWWLSVVGVGILLNLTSAYMKSPLDRLLFTVGSLADSH